MKDLRERTYKFVVLFLTFNLLLFTCLYAVEHKWQKSKINVVGPTYYDSFGESLGKLSLVYELMNLYNFEDTDYSAMTKRGYLYFPPYYYLALEGQPYSYVMDWYIEKKSNELKTSLLVNNMKKNWSFRRIIVFTPYTLSKLQLPGIRGNIDVKGIKTEFDIVYSRLDPQEPDIQSTPELGVKETTTPGSSWAELVAGHSKLKELKLENIGEMTLGMSYVGVQRMKSPLIQKSTDTLKIYGFDWDGKIKGFNLKGEYAINRRELLPAVTSAYVFCLQADKNFFDGNLTVGGEYYKIDPEYSTTYGTPPNSFNLIDDNDDSDKWVDYSTEQKQGTGQAPGMYDKTNPESVSYIWPATLGTSAWPGTIFNLDYDRDSNEVMDWEQLNLAYVADNPVFWSGEDRNNNWLPDKYEDDTLPDYTYWSKDLQGKGYFVRYKFTDLTGWLELDKEEHIDRLISPIQLTAGTLSESMITNVSSATNVSYWILNYEQNFSENIKLKFQYESKKVRDNYPNDLVAYGVYGGPDKLDFTDSQYNITTLETNFIPVENLNVQNIYKVWFNNKLDLDTIQERRGFSTRLAYSWKFPEIITKPDPTKVLTNITFLPKYRYVTTILRDDLECQGGNSHNLIFQIRYEPIKKLYLNFGRNLLWTRNTDEAKEKDEDLLAFEISTEGAVGGYSFVLYAGYQNLKAVRPGKSEILKYEDIYFVRLYVK
ncbi:MAG: hypothetical protein COY53_00705 [Elusimicrobia bacterium CG_4_10_14_0_8_um_filter_37_32]|nr:MAG: hypothetical protein COY53_00705 [Elusimicrobia bacterium CG_4_10_14_0_8_um_filter_37_32]